MRTVSRTDVESALGPFDQLDELGQPSGSGECWRAVSGTDEFAIKIVVREHEPGRFDREVEGLLRLSSDRVMTVAQRGLLNTASGQYPYLISEFIPGTSVREALALGSPSDGQLRDFVFGVLEGLAQFASANIVHRDLKPENIVLRSGDWSSPVIIDLGLCRLLDASFTVYPWAIGTWPYMAPEQLLGERALDRTDVWALAVVAVEVATGIHPHHRGEPAIPSDWMSRLQSGLTAPGARPHAFGDFVVSAGVFQAFRRPTAAAALGHFRRTWV